MPLLHPRARSTWVEHWVYDCAKCGRTQRLDFKTPCDEEGLRLYCPWCAPQRIKTIPGHDWTRPKFWWCRNGQHVVALIGRNPRTGSEIFEPCKHHAKADPTRECEHCSQPFTPSRYDARYCSGRCRVAAHRA